MAKRILIGVIAVIILTFAGYFLATKLINNGSVNQNNKTTGTPSANSQAPQGSLLALLSTTTPIQCTFNNEGDPGKAYISPGNARLDFDSTFYITGKSTTYKYHMIITGVMLYIWRDNETGGILTTFGSLSPIASPTPSTLTDSPTFITGGFLSDANYNYNCSSWTEDPAMFRPPQNLSFKEKNYTTIVTPVPSGSKPVQ